MRAGWIALALAIPSLALAAPGEGQPPGYACLDSSREAQAARRAEWARLSKDPSLSLSYWRAMRDRPPEDRVVPATEALAKLYARPCADDGERATNPRPIQAHDPLLREVSQAIAKLPDSVRQWMRRFVYAVVVAEDLGISGHTRMLEDERERYAGAIVTLNASVLRGTASTWASWKERMPFKRADGYSLRLRMDDGEDGHEALLQFVLVHELGHVLALMSGLQTVDGQEPSRRQYFDLSWTHAGSRFDGDFDERKQVMYYGTPLLQARQMVPVYEALAFTNFPTLYAATNHGEDFADSFASYVHTQVLKRPTEVIVETPQGEKRFKPCWNEPRCETKQRMLEWFLLPR